MIAERRLAIGPWQILMDEFLPSGETIVRNLEFGWARAEDLGRAMAVGYLPDMFGHIAQMPQILRRAGIDRAVVIAGVPAAIDRNAFRGAAHDGSEVRAEHRGGATASGAGGRGGGGGGRGGGRGGGGGGGAAARGCRSR